MTFTYQLIVTERSMRLFRVKGICSKNILMRISDENIFQKLVFCQPILLYKFSLQTPNASWNDININVFRDSLD